MVSNFFRLIAVIIFVLLLAYCQKEKKEEIPFQPMEENAQFIDKYFIKDGWLQTDLTDQQEIYLSESIGLWMQYLLLIGDEQRFDEQVGILSEYFMTKDSLVSWRYEDGMHFGTNALIDDFRIMTGLNEAGNLWGNKKYKEMAVAIGNSIVKLQLKNGTLVDFYDGVSSNDSLTLSYLKPSALRFLQQENLLSKKQMDWNMSLLQQIPIQNGWFAKRYFPKEKRYEFDEEVNLIDQYYIAYHRTFIDAPNDELISFTKQMLSQHGKLYGRINAKTKKFTVNYESPAVYALAFMAMERAGEEELARQLFEKMLKLRVKDSVSNYKGGYIDIFTRQTHFFDNILPLLAEAGTGHEK
ncbi:MULTISPECIES: glycosyl hydrolase family 8 [unclassified Solibacillus]|uniref:glycosyl hydrolase family 8 n=1 Tax=unclassified Solibacillus TaxID=2637870 RepID=UPI0030F9F04A